MTPAASDPLILDAIGIALQVLESDVHAGDGRRGDRTKIKKLRALYRRIERDAEPITDESPGKLWRCQMCGSPRVQSEDWVDANTNEPSGNGTGSSDSCYCYCCQDAGFDGHQKYLELETRRQAMTRLGPAFLHGVKA